jgi:hypothetical protein
MRDYTLSKEKIAELEKFHRSLRDKRQADRVKAVIALSKGWSLARIRPEMHGSIDDIWHGNDLMLAFFTQFCYYATMKLEQ